MDFSWSEDQQEFKQAVIAFAQRELKADLIELDKKGQLARDNWQKCADFGIIGLPFPEEYGGAEEDIMTTMLTMEGLGYGCHDNGLIFGINAQMWSVMMPIWLFGTEEQKKKYLPPMCRGEIIGAHGMSEPDSGSDANSAKTKAVLTHSVRLLTQCPVVTTISGATRMPVQRAGAG